MNAIMGMVSIAKDSLDDPVHIEDCLNKVETSAKFLLSLINDILDMSKIESGKMILKKKEFDFVAFVRNITAIFYSQAEKKKVHFQVVTEGLLQESYIGDELKLNQILINLLGNAIKFTNPGGSVELSIAEGKHADKSTELIFTVRDTGIGMDKAFLDKIFEPFEQDHQKENRGGSGLGLSIAGNYARMMNGCIDVESRMGEGSVFRAHVWLNRTETNGKNPSQRPFSGPENTYRRPLSRFLRPYRRPFSKILYTYRNDRFQTGGASCFKRCQKGRNPV